MPSRPFAAGLRLNRRELLQYVWLATLGALVAKSMQMLWQIARPPVTGKSGRLFSIGSLSTLPSEGANPFEVPAGRFWLVHTPAGLLALDKVCTHLDCLLGWNAQSRTFVCPCHGSRFDAEGDYLAGPAPRSTGSLRGPSNHA